MMPSITFRADASLDIGAGHVMRCLTLANALQGLGWQTQFVCKEAPGNLIDLIKSCGHLVFTLPGVPVSETQDASLTIQCLNRAALSGALQDWLVVDNYSLGHVFESSVRSVAKKVMVIDDMANRRHSCDLLLDQNLGRNAKDYETHIGAATQLLIGTRFALLRPEFAALRSISLPRRQQRAGYSHLLVSLGGVDLHNYTARTLKALANLTDAVRLRVTVVMGKASPWVCVVRDLTEALPFSTTVFCGVSNIAELMLDADLAIGAAGSSAWERCAMGLPCVQVVVADNQREAAAHLENAGAACTVNGDDRFEADLLAVLARIQVTPSALRAMANSAAAVADGLGCERVMEALMAAATVQEVNHE